jgi:D-alanine-D-alanine ligase
MSIRPDPEWWKTMFDEVYLLTDARSVCNEDITRREVDLICELLPIARGQRILDLCGGHGRHSLELCSRGFGGCTLVDYSEHLLGHARVRAAECNHAIHFVRADARSTGLPSASFDHVLIMGNSLGYLQDPEADRQILAESHRLLQPGGWLLTDLTDGAAVLKRFNPEAWHEIGLDIVVCRQREMLENTVYVREMVLSKQTGLIRDRTYSIRFYLSGEIVEMFERAGFTNVKVVNDFSPHRMKGDFGFMNYRMIALGQKA